MSRELVLVRWIDSMSYARWESADEIAAKLLENLDHETVGWVIHEDGRVLILAASRHTDDHVFNDAMAIPKVAVLSRAILISIPATDEGTTERPAEPEDKP